MNLENLLEMFAAHRCQKIYVKRLSPNDNSKNQVYLGGSFETVNIFPFMDIISEEPGNNVRTRFKAKLNFGWLTDDGNLSLAPTAQLILYPKYPEVRFSGFLQGSPNAPNDLMTQRTDGRLLFLGVADYPIILGYVTAPDSQIAGEFEARRDLDSTGVFKILATNEHQTGSNARLRLLTELRRIHRAGWIDSKRFDSGRGLLPCESSNCGGYTLEAELGISSNGFAEPDYLGWEVKQFATRTFDSLGASVITLMTPEPTGGYYKTEGAAAFVMKFGYADKMGRADRMNFGGVHRTNVQHATTKLTLNLLGFDAESTKITDSDGAIALADAKGAIAASWSFSSLLLHWNRKHAKAAYIPSMMQTAPKRRYAYGNKIILGNGTDFMLFLKQMQLGHLYYDPGIKLEQMSSAPKLKRRSQFRIKSSHLQNLYHQNEIVNLET
jgi:hypothetical protein